MRLITEDGFRAVVIGGDPGIGKSTVFDHVVGELAGAGWLVVVARPTEAERELPYSGLVDLLGGHSDVVDRLPPTLRDPMNHALLRVAAEAGVERHAVGRATAALLDLMGRDRPLLLAVDDVQWLDSLSAAALAFALRRHEVPTSAALLTRPTNAGADLLFAGRLDVEMVKLGPLTDEAIDQLVRDRIGRNLPRPRTAELHHLALGNPLHALEIAYAAAGQEVDASLHLPGSLTGAIERRLSELDAAGLEATLIVAIAGELDERTLRAVVSDRRGLDEAVRRRVLVVTSTGRIRCDHPMLGAVVLGLATPWEVRRLHRALADTVTDDSRLRHSALGAEGPDESLADELENVAAQHSERAAHEAAALFALVASQLSTDPAAQRRRRFAEAKYLLAAGDTPRAQRRLEDLVADTEDPHERARTLLLLADTVGDDMARSIDLARQALALATSDPAVTAECHGLLEVLTWLDGDVTASAEHCRQAAVAADAAGDEPLLACSLAELCHLQALLEGLYDPALMERALALEARLTLPVTTSPTFVKGLLATFLDEPEVARPLLEASLERAKSLGDESVSAVVLFRMGELDLRVGHWGDALRKEHEFLDLTLQAQTAHEQAVAMGAVAMVAAHSGLVEEARTRGEESFALALQIGDRMSEVRSRAALGFLDLSLGDVSAARSRLEPAQRVLDRMRIAELSIHHVSVNLIDALVLDDDLAAARRLVNHIHRLGERSGRSWHRVVALRGGAMIAAAEGDLARALGLAQCAVDGSVTLPQPFEQARTLLVLGDVARRAGRRSEARAALTSALEQFDELGAPLWADRAAVSLSRIAGRAPASESGLTPMELRVVEAVAQGRSNREVASELFVAVRTVESNLTRVYAKLGVRNRSELIARFNRR